MNGFYALWRCHSVNSRSPASLTNKGYCDFTPKIVAVNQSNVYDTAPVSKPFERSLTIYLPLEWLVQLYVESHVLYIANCVMNKSVLFRRNNMIQATSHKYSSKLVIAQVIYFALSPSFQFSLFTI